MYSFEELHKKVEEQIKNINLQNKPYGLYQPIEYTLDTGGKRLRPILTLMAANMFSDDIENTMQAAIAIEIFHNFTLLHDDLMDEADIRRNKATVHKKWSANTAILSGDAMIIKAFEFLSKSKVKNKDEIIKIFNQTALEVCEGQQYDMNFETRADVSENEYINMIKLKTSVLLAACLKIGALSVGAEKKHADSLYNFGINIGLSFQLQDDYLDTFGDVETFGKSIGGDIKANKKTFLLIKSLELANHEQYNELNELITQENYDSKYKIKRVTQLFKKLDIDKYTKEQIEKYNSLAIKDLSLIDISSDKKTLLFKLTDKLLNRKH